MTRPREPREPESPSELLAALSCRAGRDGTDLPELRLSRLNTLLKGYDGVSALVPVSDREHRCVVLGSESSRATAFLGIVSTSGELRHARGTPVAIPSRCAPIRRSQFTKAARRRSALCAAISSQR